MSSRTFVRTCSLLSFLLLYGFVYSTAAQQIVTVAGGAVRDGAPATAAALSSPHFSVKDRAGNLLISDYDAHRIRKVNSAGIISTAAGTGISGYSGDGGPATAAMISFPYALVLDRQGNLIFSDFGNNRVRRIDAAGIITTIAGNGTAGYTGDGGPATAASLNGPRGLAFDAGGNLFVSDSQNSVVRKIDTAGIIQTIAGNGTAGFGGDGGPATSASLNLPFGIVLDRVNNLYIADTYNYRVRRVDASGVITTIAGSGLVGGCTGDGGPATAARLSYVHELEISSGALLISSGCSRIRSVNLSTQIINTVAGVTTGFNGDGLNAIYTDFSSPHGLLLDRAGNQIVADSNNGRIRQIDHASGLVSTLAGGYTGDGGPAKQASLNFPPAIAFDSANTLYIADQWNHRVRAVDATGKITTVAGTGISGYTGDGGPATASTLNFPQAVAADRSGNVFIADQAGAALRRIDPTGTINTLKLGLPLIYVSGLTTDHQGNLYVVEDAFCVVWKVTPGGQITRVAGLLGNCGYNSDGIPAIQAWLSPWSIGLDTQGNVFIADIGNNRVRKVDQATGIITTVAGNGTCAFSGDGGPATSAMLCFPEAVAVDRSGTIYIADEGNARIRYVDLSGNIQTLAGTGTIGYNGDGAASQANLDSPAGLAISTAGRLFVLDQGQSRVRKIQ